jgi:hypothetical protein
MSNPEIRFVSNNDIDRERWDKCIAHSPFGIAYAFSWYLDRICPKWDALISEDYQYVMPLVNSRKYGIRYIYQPFFTQQLGLFSGQPIDADILNRFVDSIPRYFRLIDMNLNLGNTFKPTNISIKENTTYHLNLQPAIDEIRSAYNSNTRRNIQKAKVNQVTVSRFSDVGYFVDFTRKNLLEKSPEIKKNHYSALQAVIAYAVNNGYGEIYAALNTENQLLAAVFFLKTSRSCIYLAATSNQEGIDKSAMFLLVDTFIENNSGNNLVLDFEGSNIQGIARFYAGFGASPQTYFSVHQNRLPAILKAFKK